MDMTIIKIFIYLSTGYLQILKGLKKALNSFSHSLFAHKLGRY